jgi:hypothetical protein
MRLFRIVDTVPKDQSEDINDDTEPSIAVNPVNPLEMVVTAFTPPKVVGDVNAPVYFSADGGETWALQDTLPGAGTGPFFSEDQTISFGTTTNEFYIANVRGDTFVLNVDRSDDPTSNVVFTMLEGHGNVDQPWIRAITVPNGPDKGKDRLYVGYNSSNGAMVDLSLDALGSPNPFQPQPVKLESRTVISNGFHIRPAPHGDGTIYVGYESLNSPRSTGTHVNMMLARDDNWGKNNFTALTDPSDGKSGRIVASVLLDATTPIGGQRADNGFDVQPDPNNSNIVYMCWIDNNATTPTLRVRRSLNRGVDWSNDLFTDTNPALAIMAINSRGTVALAYLKLVSGQWEMHFRTTSDGTTWDDTLLARTADKSIPSGNDYMGLRAVGPHFYGVFPAINTPGVGHFFPNGGGKMSYLRNVSGTNLVGLDGIKMIASSVDPFFYKVEEKDVSFILERSTFGQDEIDARRNTGKLPVTDAFRVVVDGFTAKEFVPPLTSKSDVLDMPNPPGMVIKCSGNTSGNNDYGLEMQRFTFHYDIDFPTDSAFNFAGAFEDVTLTVAAGRQGVPAFANIRLLKQPNPFILHGDPPWLSIDLRIFVVRAGETKFGVTMGPDASFAPAFIQTLMATITPAQFETLSADETASSIFLYPIDNSNVKIFNFALAKVHYIASTMVAPDVRVFFRLFSAQITSGVYDFPPGAEYRRSIGLNPDGHPIPVAGIRNNEYVAIPCFAEARVDTTINGMDKQTDKPNVQTFTPAGDGSEVDHFFGCWLDVNQPFKVDGTPNNVLPVQVPANNVDGPFVDPNNPPLPIQQAIIRNLHQCVIAEIAFDPVITPLGKDPSNWDKLAQRNIAWSDIGSANAVSTFEMRPTPKGLSADQPPEELMIDWGTVRSDSSAQIYLPAVASSDILKMADTMYTSHYLTRVDDHTIKFPTGGITYIPIPPGEGPSYAGLFTVTLADSKRGELFNVVVRQVANDSAEFTPPPGFTSNTLIIPSKFNWRRVVGAFQLTIEVLPKPRLLIHEERRLSVLRWIGEAIPHESRWSPVFRRYLHEIAGRVSAFGGNPTHIRPSPTGDGRRKHHCPKHRCPKDGCHDCEEWSGIATPSMRPPEHTGSKEAARVLLGSLGVNVATERILRTRIRRIALEVDVAEEETV